MRGPSRKLLRVHVVGWQIHQLARQQHTFADRFTTRNGSRRGVVPNELGGWLERFLEAKKILPNAVPLNLSFCAKCRKFESLYQTGILRITGGQTEWVYPLSLQFLWYPG